MAQLAPNHRDDDVSIAFNLDSLPRSASYTQLPATTRPDTSFERDGVKRTFSENLIANPKTNTFRDTSIKKISKRNRELEDRPGQNRLLRRLSTHSKSGPQITISGFQLGGDEDDPEIAYQPTVENNTHETTTGAKSKSVSSSLARLKRQSWMSSSRSPSPSTRKLSERRPNTADGDAGLVLASPLPPDVPDAEERTTPNICIPNQINNHGLQRKKTRRPLSSYLSMTNINDAKSKTPSIPKSFSTDRLPLSHAHTSSEKPPSLPSSKSFERLNAFGADSPRRKDDLWGAFRALEADFQKFQSRSSSMKSAVVRTTLLPFLKSHSEPLPNFTLRPEDLDRRVNILNRWWTGLLEMINGRNGESVSGSDRPTILEAVTAIMIRPEWSVSPSTSPCRSPKPSLKSRSTTSLKSTVSDFLTESVIHNVRNTYVQNLLAQMAFVVNKLSVRCVPASVVAFCGRAIAYAFFYCDGVAEILVRLWSISLRNLARVHEASGLSRATSLSLASEKISARFPGCIQKLAFTSSRSMIRYLRNRPQVPIATAYIPWDGPWTGRWAGRDTDLFYSFAKQYYDLLSQHLPEDASTEEFLCAPGHALLQAQLLCLLDATILRTNSQPSFDSFKGSSFDEVLNEADASAAVLPISPTTMVRSMAENRLIMLLRDCLSANVTISPRAKDMFAKAFEALLKATARQTSRFDHLACFTLCDFLEEAIVIFVRFDQSSVDWPFWIHVCKLMMASNNSMTEIRLCTFLYSLWNTVTVEEQRKKEICLGWLLNEDTFGRLFNHWCPMVRAYFMRLLIWRMGRLDGNASDLGSEILQTLSLRLHQIWRHFLHIEEDARRNGSVAPSTAPCTPAPSRCLLIIRNESPTPPMFLSFDSILPPSQRHGFQRANQKDTSNPSLPPAPARRTDEDERSSTGTKKRWGLLKNIIPFTNSSAKQLPGSPEVSRSPSTSNITASPPNRTNINPAESEVSKPLQAPTQYHTTHSFKFALEWIDRGQLPSRDKRLYPPKLPLPAQLYLQSQHFEWPEHTPLKPGGRAVGESKYAGRALAEWALLVVECHNFFERRKQEGVPDNSKVETPTLCVESFRRT